MCAEPTRALFASELMRRVMRNCTLNCTTIRYYGVPFCHDVLKSHIQILMTMNHPKNVPLQQVVTSQGRNQRQARRKVTQTSIMTRTFICIPAHPPQGCGKAFVSLARSWWLWCGLVSPFFPCFLSAKPPEPLFDR